MRTVDITFDFPEGGYNDPMELLQRTFDLIVAQPLTWKLAALTGALQVTGYLFYIHKQLWGKVKSGNGTWLTWLMFAYGTFVLTILEIAVGASWPLLVLPISCWALSMVVAYISRHGAVQWKKVDFADKAAFLMDVSLTVCYVTAGVLRMSGSITEYQREIANMLLLVGSNLSSFTAFAPLIKEAYESPLAEKSRAWIVWTSAYTTLAVLTYMETSDWVLLIYPVTNVFLHGSMAVLVRPSRRRRHAARKKNPAT